MFNRTMGWLDCNVTNSGGPMKCVYVFRVVGYILPSFYVLRLKLWEKAENLGKKTGASHRRGELKRCVITI